MLKGLKAIRHSSVGQRTKDVVTVAIHGDGNITKKEHEKLDTYQGLGEELEKAWRVKMTMVSVVIRALKVLTPKLEK